MNPVSVPQKTPGATRAGRAGPLGEPRRIRFSAKVPPISPTSAITTGSGTIAAVAQPMPIPSVAAGASVAAGELAALKAEVTRQGAELAELRALVQRLATELGLS